MICHGDQAGVKAMKKRLLFCGVGVFLIPVVLFISRDLISTQEDQLYAEIAWTSDAEKPFRIAVNSVNIIEESLFFDEKRNSFSRTDVPEKRLVLDYTIENVTDNNYKDVQYSVALNEAVTPFIADGNTTYKQDKMDVFSEKMVKNLSKQKINLIKGHPVIWGFDTSWGIMLTTPEGLKTYFNLSESGIYDALKCIEVHIYWDGGEQHEIIELELHN